MRSSYPYYKLFLEMELICNGQSDLLRSDLLCQLGQTLAAEGS